MTRETLDVLYEYQKNKEYSQRFENHYIGRILEAGEMDVLMVKSHQKSYSFDINVNWFDMFGKYFIARDSSNKKVEYFYPILSLSPSYLTLKKMWLESIDSSLPDTLKEESY